MAIGRLKVQVFRGNSLTPVDNARVTILPSSGQLTREAPKVLRSDSSGITGELELTAPPLEYSQTPTDNLPYSLYDIRIEADGFVPQFIEGCQVFPDVVALQQSNLIPQATRQVQAEQTIIVEPNTLVGNFLPKIPEDPNKPDPPPPTGLVVLPEPVVPEFVVVHAGRPDDDSAPNYTVRYKDYIKNVASCEIFSTWPQNTIRANAMCIISFTLNRIYTEWYRGKGKNFDITSSTAFDHAFSYGRNIYDTISVVVDELFATYMKRPDRKQPLLAQYCDGVQVQCPGWLTQWGSKFLGDQGRTPYEILTNFYGSDLSLTRAKEVEGIPQSYPGTPLRQGSRGTDVRTIQTYLNRIAQNYPAIPKVRVDGVFGPETTRSVTVFQQIFNLPQNGIVDYATWYSISNIYVAVTQIAELRGIECSEFKNGIFVPPAYKMGTNGFIPTAMYPEEY